MPIKNYTTTVPANRSINQIQDALIKHGATGVVFNYEKGTGRIAALIFKLDIKGNTRVFNLPCEWRKFQLVLKQQEVRRYDDEDYVYRVAWRNIRDLVLAQLAFCETEMAEVPQLFFPFAMSKNGKTFFEQSEQLLLDN